MQGSSRSQSSGDHRSSSSHHRSSSSNHHPIKQAQPHPSGKFYLTVLVLVVGLAN